HGRQHRIAHRRPASRRTARRRSHRAPRRRRLARSRPLTGQAMTLPLLFTPISLRELSLKNRVVIAPMHQYSARNGFATDWHLMNAGRYAAGGAGLVCVESTKVSREGCGTLGDLGLWRDEHIEGA